jgi:S-adenosylmethionine synthetase
MKREIELKIQTCESVGRGHPDKMCDGISDAILTAYLAKDKNAHVACESVAFNKTVVVGGEFKSSADIDRLAIAKAYVKKIWPEYADEFEFLDRTTVQSAEIDHKVSMEDDEIGAGYQGITVGYACNENSFYLPTAHVLGSLIMKNINLSGYPDFFQDTKTLVSINEKKHAEIVLAISHKAGYDIEKAKNFCRKTIQETIDNNKLNVKTFEISFNMAGDFTIHGSVGDSGLTGRKLAVDTYGSIANHGGGAFSGKDYTKVDRSGAYYSR